MGAGAVGFNSTDIRLPLTVAVAGKSGTSITSISPFKNKVVKMKRSVVCFIVLSLFTLSGCTRVQNSQYMQKRDRAVYVE